jgi:hypothetical protein
MPKLYFWQPGNQSHGILQAVLPWKDCDRLVDRASALPVGDEFPTDSRNWNGQPTVAILHVHPEEANEKWIAGFYLLDMDIVEIHEGLRALKRSPPSSVTE